MVVELGHRPACPGSCCGPRSLVTNCQLCFCARWDPCCCSCFLRAVPSVLNGLQTTQWPSSAITGHFQVLEQGFKKKKSNSTLIVKMLREWGSFSLANDRSLCLEPGWLLDQAYLRAEPRSTAGSLCCLVCILLAGTLRVEFRYVVQSPQCTGQPQGQRIIGASMSVTSSGQTFLATGKEERTTNTG